MFGGVNSNLLPPSTIEDPLDTLYTSEDSNFFQNIVDNTMANDLRDILREKAEKHREYYSTIVGTDNTNALRSSVSDREMADEVLNADVNTEGVVVPESDNIERKTRTRRRGVYEIEGMVSTEFKSVKMLRENYIAMLEKTCKQLSRINENPDNSTNECPKKLSEKPEGLVDNPENTGEKLEVLNEKSELLVPPSSGYCSSTASGASDDEREKNWRKPERRSGSSDSAVHSDEEGPIASNWGEKREDILPNDGYQPKSPYSPRCSIDHSNVPTRTIIEAHYVPFPIDRKFSVDVLSEDASDAFDDSRRHSCFSDGEDQPRYRYWRTPSVVVSDYSDDIMGLTLEDIEYIRSRRENSMSPDSSLHSSCSNLNYCGSNLSGLDGDYVLFQPYRKSSNCSTCSTVSDEEDSVETLQPKKEVVGIFGIAGACRRDELQKLSTEDIEEAGSVLIVKVPRSKTDKERSFVIRGEVEEGLNLINIYHKYTKLRPNHIPHKRFFIYYQNEKCTVQGIGVNTFAKIPSEIAKFLNLENPNLYTGHCFRRSSATLLADTGADILELKRHGGWKSSTVAEGYVEESHANKLSVAKLIFQPEGNNDVQLPSTSTFTAVTNQEVDLKSTSLRNIRIENCTNCSFTFNIEGKNKV